MRILWISSHGGNYKSNVVKGTGGWIGALQTILTQKCPEIELGIAFPYRGDDERAIEGNVTYYPINPPIHYSIIDRIKARLGFNISRPDEIQDLTIIRLQEIIKEYKPDLVHVWGVENMYSAIIPYIKDLPFVVHIQGLTSACLYAYIPPGVSIDDIYKCHSWKDKKRGRAWEVEHIKSFRKRAANEIVVSKYVKNWIGRTEWDYVMSQMLSPNSRYFHCEELMRGDFDGATWQYHFDGKTIKIQSAISTDWYKGVDVILKTSSILKEQGVTIAWRVYGWNREDNKILEAFIKRTGINPESVGVCFMGSVDAPTIKQGLLDCDIYVHPSYIENSSNAIAEAQMTGVPVIAQHVGGNATMLKNDSGILVAPNEPYILAHKIMSLRDKNTADGYSQRALAVAKERQDRDQVISNLLGIYETIIKGE